MCTVLGRCRFRAVRLIGALMRNSVIATVFAPAGTMADTAIGRPRVAAVTLTARAASGAGESSGASACPSGVTAGAAAADRHRRQGRAQRAAGDASPAGSAPRSAAPRRGRGRP